MNILKLNLTHFFGLLSKGRYPSSSLAPELKFVGLIVSVGDCGVFRVCRGGIPDDDATLFTLQK
jgi:hypothetical protein